MAAYKLTYTVKIGGRKFTRHHYINAKNAKDAIMKLRTICTAQNLDHPFTPKAEKIFGCDVDFSSAFGLAVIRQYGKSF